MNKNFLVLNNILMYNFFKSLELNLGLNESIYLRFKFHFQITTLSDQLKMAIFHGDSKRIK